MMGYDDKHTLHTVEPVVAFDDPNDADVQCVTIATCNGSQVVGFYSPVVGDEWVHVTPSDADLAAIREWAAPGSGAAHLELVGVMLLAWLREWHRMTEWTTASWRVATVEVVTRSGRWAFYGAHDGSMGAWTEFGPFDTVDGIPAAEWLKRLRAGGER